jgi:DNA polymerase-3 subunit alpha
MTQPTFVHLRLHSEYSIQDGIVRIDEAVKRALADRMPALALTDLANVFGLVKFYQAARGAGVKPILGCDAWLANAADRDKPFRILLLAQNRAGYLRLCELLARAYRANQHRGRAELAKAWFGELGTEGLIALSGAHLGDVGHALLAGNLSAAESLALEWSALFPGRFYLEVQRHGTTEAESHVRQAARLAARCALPVVATHPVQFLAADDFKAHEARVCIAEGYILADQRRPKRFTPEQYFKSQAEMAALFADLPEALANSVEIARRCNLSLTLGKSQLPDYPTPGGESLDNYLRSQAGAGLERRLAALFPEPRERDAQRPRYTERLEFELGTIIQMGFPGYFLIVADFINWAKQNGVPVGPGRGSGAGSLAAYSLGITDLDPLRYDLLFERFLNPERVSMPDFDIDFCQDGRDRVIEYVRERYGADSVSQIATFGTMAARAVVRDVGRVLDLGYNFCDQIAKLIPMQPGKQITLAQAREMEPMLAEREQNEEEVRELLELGERLEGLTRNVGMHAGGVLIAPGKLTDFCPLYAAQGADSVVSQFDKDDVEAVGLVKFDFLGLTTLTILDWTEKLVRAAGESAFSLERIPLDDRATFDLFAAGNTTAVFQLESRGMKDMIKRAKPDRFEDVIALVALYRPGPMDLIPDFTDRKHGRQRVEYLDPRLEQILGPTYGIMVYQEQVMQIAQVIGGYTLGGADLLRRAMGKKKPEEMAKHRDIFVAGAERNGLSKGKASQLFDLMEKFAGYGFNKSHAAAYALLAYQTAYLKAHHAAAFMAANLSAVMDDTDKVRLFHEDALANGLVILPPDVNLSDYRFTPKDAKTVRYGLGAIKGTGESAIAGIVDARARGGPFRDLFDFCERVDKRLVNRRVIESLVRAGAFDAITDHRASLLATVGLALESAEQVERAAHQVSLFEALDTSEHGPRAHRDVARWADREKLQNEKAALGFYLSGHPFDGYAPELRPIVPTPLGNLQPGAEPRRIAGIVHGVRVQQSRRGRMGIVVLDDGTGRVELTLFNELFETSRGVLKEDQPLVAEGKVVQDDFTGGLRMTADAVWDLAAARDRFARGMRITCNGGSSGPKLKELLGPYRAVGNGGCPVSVLYSNGSAACEIELGEDWRVSLQDSLMDGLHAWFEPGNVRVIY